MFLSHNSHNLFRLNLVVDPAVESAEIHMAPFGGHLFYDLFLQGRGGGHDTLGPLDPLLLNRKSKMAGCRSLVTSKKLV